MAMEPGPDWYLPHWITATATTQADLVRRTDYPKSKMSMLVNGKRKYHRDDINELSRALNIEPFELLMHPEDAMRMRRLRDTALSIAADAPTAYRAPPNRTAA